MKTLILMRHAKSSWATPGQPDHDRPLNTRGKQSAPVMGRWLVAQGLVPDAILCSSAKRARQTVKRMRAEVAELPAPTIEPDLYESGPDEMQSCLAKLPSGCGSAMIVAHEPGMGEMLSRLTGCEHGPFPTAAIAVLDLDIGAWGEEPWLRARLRKLARPRDLMEPSEHPDP
jgi:phosphohistidine phosphatase